MNDLDQLIKSTVDSAIDEARRLPVASRHRTRIPMRLRVASAVALAAACVVALALTPWSRDTGSSTGATHVLPAIESASARDVLDRTAARVSDEGSGSWRYVRSSTWTRDYMQYGGFRCGGKTGSLKCVTLGPDHKTPIDIKTVPFVRNGSMEMWSTGTKDLARRQYAFTSNGTDRCLKPSADPRCLGWEYRLLHQIDPPTTFPEQPPAGRHMLEQLALARNAATKSAMSSGRFPTRGAALTPGEVAFRLLTNPVYDAANRARVIRAIGMLPGSKNLGTAKDSLGRSGIRLSINTTRRPYGTDGHLGHSIDGPSKILAIFDVDAGQLLEYETHSRWTPYTLQRTVIDEQRLQTTPTPTDDEVELIR